MRQVIFPVYRWIGGPLAVLKHRQNMGSWHLTLGLTAWLETALFMPLWDCHGFGGLKPPSVVALSLILGALISFFGYVPPWQDLKKNEPVNPFSWSLFITPSNQSQSKLGGCLFPFPHTGLPFLEVSIHIYSKFQVTVRSLRIWENRCSLSNEGISLTIWYSKSKLRNCDKQ